MNNIFDKIKRPYYYVPPCPVCGSRQTGRFTRSKDAYNDNWSIREALKNGEYLTPIVDPPEDVNAYCLECEHIWKAEIEVLMLNKDEIRNEMKSRQTPGVVHALTLEKREQDAEKSKHRGFIVDHIAKFVGHL